MTNTNEKKEGSFIVPLENQQEFEKLITSLDFEVVSSSTNRDYWLVNVSYAGTKNLEMQKKLFNNLVVCQDQLMGYSPSKKDKKA